MFCVPPQKAATDRVESDILRPDIMIEVNRRPGDNQLESEAPPEPPTRTESLRVSSVQGNDDDEEEEDTVIYTASDGEMATSREGGPTEPTSRTANFQHADSIHVVSYCSGF